MSGFVGYITLSNIGSDSHRILKQIMEVAVNSIRVNGVDTIGASYITRYKMPDKKPRLFTRKCHLGSSSNFEEKLSIPLAKSLFTPILNSECGHYFVESIDGDPTKLSQDEIQPFSADAYSVCLTGSIQNTENFTETCPRIKRMVKKYNLNAYSILKLALDAKDSSDRLGKTVATKLQGNYSFSLLDGNKHRVLLACSKQAIFICIVKINYLTLGYSDYILVYSSSSDALKFYANIIRYVSVEVSGAFELPDSSYLDVSLHSEYYLSNISATQLVYRFINNAISVIPPPSVKRCVVLMGGSLKTIVAATLAASKYTELHLLYLNDDSIHEPTLGSKLSEYLTSNFNCKVTLKSLPGTYIDVDTDTRVAFTDLSMVSQFVAYAEYHKLDTIISTLSQSNTRRKTSIDLIQGLSDLINSYSNSVKIETPLLNMHEKHIMEYAKQIGAPLHLLET